MRTVWTRSAIAAVALIARGEQAHAAIGCTLSNPAQDLKYLFPDLTTYREEVRELARLPDGPRLFQLLRDRVGSDLDPIYETYETPYTLYTVFKGQESIGLVHGVNVPGAGGVIQVFLSVDPATGSIRELFFQRIESPAAKLLRGKEFRAQFAGLTLADFYRHDYYAAADPQSASDRLGRLWLPPEDSKGRTDAAAALRGVRKNLILLDIFLFGQRNEVFYQRAREALARLGASGTGPPPGQPSPPAAAPAPQRREEPR